MYKTYGYMRVSSEQQKDFRQKVELLNYGIPEKQLYADKISGTTFNRPAWKRLMRKLRKDDVLVVKSLDRLGRNYREVGEQWRYISVDMGVHIVVLDMPLLDTRNQHDLIGTLISDLVLILLSYVGQQEREFIHQRQAEGIAAAHARGVKFGRPCKPLPSNFDAIYRKYLRKEVTSRQAADLLQINYNAFMWLHRKRKAVSHRSV